MTQRRSTTGSKISKNSKYINYLRNCEDIYNKGKYNFHVVEWAIKEIVQEEREEQEAKEKK